MSDDENKQSGQSQLPASTNIQAVHLKLPPFWEKNPQLWFVQAEVQFTVYKVVADSTKYCHAVAALPPQICETVYDVLMNPPDNQKYATLKTALINRHALSEEKRLEKLLERAELGDQKPSEVLREMKRLAGDTVSDAIIKKLWLRRLPQYMTIPLISAGEKPINDLTDLADKIYEASDSPKLCAIASAPSSSKSSNNYDSQYNELKQQIAKLESMIQNISIGEHNSRSKSPQTRQNFRGFRSRSRSRSRGQTWCWYHQSYGTKAKKCIKPCSFVNKNSTDSNSPN